MNTDEMSSSNSAESEDFTDAGYESIVRFVAERWPTTYFADADKPGRRCLWRHDVDFSLHRAKRMSEIEFAHKIKATYFILVHSEFYNLLEPDLLNILKGIVADGHEIALHFDPTCHDIQSEEDLISSLSQDRRLLESLSGQRITTFTYHLPDGVAEANKGIHSVAGMLNASHERLQESYTYCSDSNGYWRFKPLWDVLLSDPDRLYVLSHPSLWTPAPMAPRQRIERCISGRARNQRLLYDGILARFSRENRRVFGSALSTLADHDPTTCYAFEALLSDGLYLPALYMIVSAISQETMAKEHDAEKEQLAQICAAGLSSNKPSEDAIIDAIRVALALLAR